MKRLLLVVLSITASAALTQCKKEKYCHVCSTFNERTYANGSVTKDTIDLQICQDEDFIKAHIENGTFDGPYFELKDGDTIRYHLVMSTICTRK